MNNPPKIEEILSKFVSVFVAIFDGYMDEYHTRLIERIPKKGKTADNLDGAADIVKGATEMLEGPVKAGAIVIFEVFRKTAGYVGNKCNRDDLKKLSTKLREYNKGSELKQIVIKSGAEIFRSFESQFSRLSADDGSWETAVEKMAEDVVNRIIYHLKKNPEKELIERTILEGVLFGESKTYRSPNSDLPNMHKGHSVIIGGFNIKTSDLFKKVGLVSDSGYFRYKSKSWGLTDLNRCGFRLLYEWEDVNLYTKYTKLSQPPPEMYKYRLTDEALGTVQFEVLDQMKAKRTSGHLENILEDMRNEADKATEELAVLLKENFQAVKMMSGEFNKVHESLDKIQKVTSEFDAVARESRDILLNLQVQFDHRRTTLKKVTSTILFDVVEPSILFSGRKEELKRLEDSLFRNVVSNENFSVLQHMTCISGLGGIGKSELVKRYISGCRSELRNFEDFIWLNAENEASLTNSFLRLAEDEMNITMLDAKGTPKDTGRVVKDVYAFLSGRRCLVVLDNAENQKYLKRFLPLVATASSVPFFILTSRDTEWDKRIEVLHLEGMTTGEAVEFVQNGLESGNERADVEVLVDKLQYFPLAIQQAISYIQVQREVNEEYKVVNYLKELEDKTQKLLSSDDFQTLLMDNTYSNTTFTTWNITVDQIQDHELGKLAVDILNLMAYLSPDNILRSMFFRLPDVTEDNVRHATRILVKYSMVKGESGQSILKIHRLVQQVTRINLDVECKSKTTIDAVRTLLMSNIPDDSKSESCETMRRLLPHLEVLYIHLKQWIVKRPEDEERIERTFILKLLLNIGNVCKNLGKSWRAKQVYEDALAIVKKRDGKDDRITVAIISVDFCSVLCDLGQYTEPLDTIEKALPILEDYYHRDARFADALEKKAAVLVKLGEREKAELAFREILSINERCGDELGSATAKINLSIIYGLKGDVQKKKTLLEEGLSVFEKHYESDHIKLASARFQLSTVYRALGDFNSEIEIIEKCLLVFEKVYGEGQAVARLLLTVGAAYGKTGDCAKDLFYTTKAVEMLKNHYRDESHIEVARFKSHLANVMGGLGDKEEQLRLLKCSLIEYEKFYEGGSWDTAYLLVEIANAHHELGQSKDTGEALQRAIGMMETHPRDTQEEDRAYINKLKIILSTKYSGV